MIDIGQIEGAYINGIGYYTTEKIVFDEEGQLLTDNTWTYLPPGAKDIPVDFRVKIPKNNPNPLEILKTKAVGEPPLCLAVSVALALRNAIASARKDAGSQDLWFPIGKKFLQVNTNNNFDFQMVQPILNQFLCIL